MQLREKEDQLCRILSRYNKAAVAFSGGADSSLLLWYAVKVLGPENVVAFTSRSCLLKQHELERVMLWFTRHELPGPVQHEFIDITPLEWEEFVANPGNRCYLCKNRVYSLFLNRAKEMQISTLFDGTNADDMQSDRPGLRTLRELGVVTPLAGAGFSKKIVRLLSRDIGLDTWDRPSSSCLATRIPCGLEITDQRIKLINKAESILEEMGFTGCRIRLDAYHASTACVQVQDKDVQNITRDRMRAFLLEKLKEIGFSRVLLDMYGR